MAEQRKKPAGQPITDKNGKRTGVSLPISDESGDVVFDPKEVRHGGLDDGAGDEETEVEKPKFFGGKTKMKPKQTPKPKPKAPAPVAPKAKKKSPDAASSFLSEAKDNEDALRIAKKFPTWKHVNEKPLAKLQKEIKRLPGGLFRMRLGNLLRGSISNSKRAAEKAKK